MKSRHAIVAGGLLAALVAGLSLRPLTVHHAEASRPRVQLLVYCGITMIRPMAAIARIIEAETGCTITITKGGSGNLLHAIEINQLGDLYLPGSDSYIRTARERGLVDKTVLVGHNKAALVVAKGNPRGITANLANLTKPEYRVVIGNPDSGSIGRETRRILDRAGLFNATARNALRFTTDSKELARVLRDDEADVVINWHATTVWPENAAFVEALPIDDQYAVTENLVLALLRFSEHRDIARRFLDLAASPRGQEIFRTYGLFDVH